MPRKPSITAARVKKIHADLIQLPNVYGTFVGHKRKGGRTHKSSAVVCIVSEKMKARALFPERRVPKKLSWGTNQRARSIVTDVVQVGPKFVPQQGAVLGPGDKAFAGASSATVGIAVLHPEFGRCATTAAHLFEGGSEGTAVRIRRNTAPLPARAMARKISPLVDFALLRMPDGVPCDNLYDEVHRLGPVHVPTEADIGRRVFVLRANGTRVTTICRGIHAHLEPPEEFFEDAILTDCVTRAGDSGCCLVDEHLRVWGLLRGSLAGTFSVFGLAKHVLDAAGAEFL